MTAAKTSAGSLLVTGCYRSGTTVLEKLLHAHPRLVVASQPYPILYFLVKEIFLEQRGLERRYPLDHLFGEDGYLPEELHRFLDCTVLGPERITELFDRMEGYTDGLWTPEMLRFRDRIRPGTFLEVCAQLNRCIAELLPKDDPAWVGTKEVLVEELVPYLLGKGVHVFLSIRDPRAMIASLDFRDRDNLTGADRPVLYSLRAWRKSVAIALGCEKQPGFRWLRYEDVVQRPEETLRAVTDSLSVEPHPPSVFREGLRDQRGERWQGNSSFAATEGLSQAPLTAYRSRLPLPVLEFVETLCEPEMRALGYEFDAISGFDPAALERYRDPFPRIHEAFPPDYSHDPDRLARERERRSRLVAPRSGTSDEEIRRWFVTPEAFERLRAAIA